MVSRLLCDQQGPDSDFLLESITIIEGWNYFDFCPIINNTSNSEAGLF